MNKKLLIPLFAFIGLALVSAFLVNYLSNTAKVNVEVKSPMTVEFSDDGEDWTNELNLPETTGLSYIEFAIVAAMVIFAIIWNTIYIPNTLVKREIDDERRTTRK
jgi:hypothetical protein